MYKKILLSTISLISMNTYCFTLSSCVKNKDYDEGYINLLSVYNPKTNPLPEGLMTKSQIEDKYFESINSNPDIFFDDLYYSYWMGLRTLTERWYPYLGCNKYLIKFSNLIIGKNKTINYTISSKINFTSGIGPFENIDASFEATYVVPFCDFIFYDYVKLDNEQLPLFKYHYFNGSSRQMYVDFEGSFTYVGPPGNQKQKYNWEVFKGVTHYPFCDDCESLIACIIENCGFGLVNSSLVNAGVKLNSNYDSVPCIHISPYLKNITIDERS